MRESIAKKWVEELRSGKYKQGSEYLCKDNHYCCLGVLCEIFTKEVALPTFKKIKEYRDGSEMVYYDNCHDVLPADVMEWSGLSTHIGEFFDPDSSDRMASLAELNDCGYSFKKLADIIENTAELL